MTRRSIDLESIVEAAVELTTEGGWPAVTARSIAERLGCSTMPIYSQAGSMEQLRLEVVKRADALLLAEQRRPRTGNESLDLAVGYIAFAREHPRLFRFLIESPRETHDEQIKAIPMVRELLASIQGEPAQNDFLLRSWIFTHGLAELLAARAVTMDDDEIIRHLTGTAGAILHARPESGREEESDE